MEFQIPGGFYVVRSLTIRVLCTGEISRSFLLRIRLFDWLIGYLQRNPNPTLTARAALAQHDETRACDFLYHGSSARRSARAPQGVHKGSEQDGRGVTLWERRELLGIVTVGWRRERGAKRRVSSLDKSGD